jgi:protein-disulfide isomerase
MPKEKSKEKISKENTKENGKTENAEELTKGKETKTESSEIKETKETGETQEKKPFPWMIAVLAVILLIAAAFMVSKIMENNQTIKGDWEKEQSKPLVEIKNFYFSECSFCEKENSIIIAFKTRDMNVSVQSIDLAKEENKHFIQEFSLKSVPSALINTKDLQEYPFEENLIKKDFTEVNGYYVVPESYFDSMPHNLMLLEEKTCSAEEGKVFVEEFSDLQCLGCARIFEVTKKARENFAGEIIYRHKNYLVNETATDAAIATECARDQGKFIEFKKYLYERAFPQEFGLNAEPADNSSYEVLKSATFVTLIPDSNKFSECMKNKETLQRIQEETELAKSYSVNFAPSIVIDCKYVIQGNQAINSIEDILCELHPELQSCTKTE